MANERTGSYREPPRFRERPNMINTSSEQRNVIGIRKNGETWLFFYDNDAKTDRALLATFSRFAADPELSFDWKDALLAGRRAELMR